MRRRRQIKIGARTASLSRRNTANLLKIEVVNMFFSARKRFTLLSVLCLVFLFSQAVSAQDKEWRAVSPQELAMKTPQVEPDADAEAIFWETRIDDSSESNLKRISYARVKIFTERGREKFS
jgi:hypothetical protein